MSDVLHAILRSAMDATGAADGWLVALDDDADQLVVVAAAGRSAAALLGVAIAEGEGFTGFVVGSGQPIALEPSADDPRFAEGLEPRLGRRPRSVLCVPCEDDDIVRGAIELVDKPGGFSYDDLELAGVLGEVAGVALRPGTDQARTPAPAELARGIEALAAADPVRYAEVARLVEALVQRG